MAIPIHYGLDRPPLYSQTPDAALRFEQNARELGINPVILEPGEEITV
jgi:L-ascorbate metabolism protein UlaG (beta-lactamase superfamily)